MVDISGKVLNYDIALCQALSKALPSSDHFSLFAANIEPKKIDCECKKLFSLIPKSLKNSENIVKRGFKALEGVANYFYLILYLAVHKVKILHLQWLPFLEIIAIEKVFLKTIRLISPKTKIILTVHNLYPHNSSEPRKSAYRRRFSDVQRHIDKFILHLDVSRKEFCKEFCIDESRTVVIPHGIFEPKGYVVRPHVRGEKLNLIMYGNQNIYKGTDILIDALTMLPQEYKSKVHALIVGKTASNYLSLLQQKSKGLDVDFIPKFVPDNDLYRYISQSDVIVLPYREISQSGVLLLALNFNRLIITSDLPSFKETLSECPSELFFKSGNPQSLGLTLIGLINKKSPWDDYKFFFNDVKNRYLWENSARMTLDSYNKIDN